MDHIHRRELKLIPHHNMSAPLFVKCRCHLCQGKIEFDAGSFGPRETRKVICPHCHQETVLFIPQVQAPDPLDVAVEIKKGVSPLGIASLCLGLIGCVFCWIPWFGLLVIPVSVIGLLLAGIGLLIDKKSSRSFVFSGIAACLVAIGIALTVNGGLSILDNLQARHEARQQAEAAAARNRANEQTRQRDIASTTAAIASLQTSLTNETQWLAEAKNQFDAAQADYDRFRATQPWLTNAVYLKIKKDLAFRTGIITSQQQTIDFLQAELEKPYVRQTWIVDNGLGQGHLAGPTQAEQAAQKQAVRKRLIDAKSDLDGTYNRIDVDQQTLARIETGAEEFQAGKLANARTAFNAAQSDLNQVQSRLTVADKRLKILAGRE
jgi:hypothetical protein